MSLRRNSHFCLSQCSISGNDDKSITTEMLKEATGALSLNPESSPKPRFVVRPPGSVRKKKRHWKRRRSQQNLVTPEVRGGLQTKRSWAVRTSAPGLRPRVSHRSTASSVQGGLPGVPRLAQGRGEDLPRQRAAGKVGKHDLHRGSLCSFLVRAQPLTCSLHSL